MTRLEPIFCILTLVFSLQLSHGQNSIADTQEPPQGDLFALEEIDPAPSALVLDKARLFSQREFEQLSARLKEFGAQHNLTIYVVGYSVLLGETIGERATRVKEKWLEGKRGLVLVYQRGTEQMTFSSTADAQSYLDRTSLEHLFAAAYAQAGQQSRGSSRVIAAANQLMADLPVAIEQQATSNAATKAETRVFVGWALAGLVLLTAVGMFLFQFLRKTQVQVTKSYSFPPIAVKERFGAPYCGGHHAEIQFTTPNA